MAGEGSSGVARKISRSTTRKGSTRHCRIASAGQGACDSRRNAGGIHFRNRKPLLKTERSVKAVLVDEALAEKILAQSDLLRFRGERGVENRRVEISGAGENLAEFAFVLQQRGSRRIGVFGFEPNQRTMADAGDRITANSAKGRGGV